MAPKGVELEAAARASFRTGESSDSGSMILGSGRRHRQENKEIICKHQIYGIETDSQRQARERTRSNQKQEYYPISMSGK